MKLILTLLGSLSLALSCNYSKVKTPNAPTASNNTPGGASITDSQWLTENLFQARCASCHNSGRQPGGHKFETERDLLNNVATKTIVAGSPDNSSLYKIIESGAMPTRGEKATAQELQVLACWITEGATPGSSACVQKFGLSGSVDPDSNPTPTPTPTPTVNPGNNATDSQWLTRNLFQARCVSCHNSGRQPGGHKFETEQDLLDNIATKKIVAGSPDTSSLYKIIESGAMPTRGEKATAQELQMLACWITEGATSASSVCIKKFGLTDTVNPGGNSTPTPTPTPTPDPGDDDGGQDDDDDQGDDDQGDDDQGDDDQGVDDGGDGTGDGTGDGGEVPVVKFSEIQKPIFEDRCVGCHGAESPAAGVNLETLANIQNPAIVKCGDATASQLYKVVASDEMPAFSEALSADLKTKLKDWINGGCQP